MTSLHSLANHWWRGGRKRRTLGLHFSHHLPNSTLRLLVTVLQTFLHKGHQLAYKSILNGKLLNTKRKMHQWKSYNFLTMKTMLLTNFLHPT